MRNASDLIDNWKDVIELCHDRIVKATEGEMSDNDAVILKQVDAVHRAIHRLHLLVRNVDDVRPTN